MASIDHRQDMDTDEVRQDMGTDEVRQGKELGSVRWVLRISLALAVLAGMIIYFSYANFFHS